MEYIITIILIWIAVWQFIFNKEVLSNQRIILKKINELWYKIDDMPENNK